MGPDRLLIGWVTLAATMLTVLGADHVANGKAAPTLRRTEEQKQTHSDKVLSKYHEGSEWKLPLRRLARSMRTEEEAQKESAKRKTWRAAREKETAMTNFVVGLKNIKRRKGQGNKDDYLAAHNVFVQSAMYKPFIDNERALQLADEILNEWEPGRPRGKPRRSKGQTSSTPQQSHL